MPRLIFAFDGGFVVQQPAILFFLRFEKVEQGFLRARGAGRLNLLLDSSFQGRILDFYLRGVPDVSSSRIHHANIFG
jgi:hypothetical protein